VAAHGALLAQVIFKVPTSRIWRGPDPEGTGPLSERRPKG
jgi:hypothetical protein